MRARLFSADLEYGAGLTLHTATSGSLGSLSELYLLLEDGEKWGIGEVRANAAYLHGIPASKIEVDARKAARVLLDQKSDPESLLKRFGPLFSSFSAPVRMLLDMALQDMAARKLGVPVAQRVSGANHALESSTNQTLFWSPDEEFRSRAHEYMRRGFYKLKVRAGVAPFEKDLARVSWLRSAFGSDVEISIDANGTWPLAEALARLETLASLGVAYVEQPIAAGDWDAIATLAHRSPITVMLDESLASSKDVEAICSIGGKLAAHLKLIKLGGIGAAWETANRFGAAGIPMMIGQMNEGSVATAAALHLAVATSASRAELYGADGLVNDPASGMVYGDGTAKIVGEPGLGIQFDATKARLIEEFN